MIELRLARDALTSSARTGLAHAAAAGSLIRVARGAYADASEWAALGYDDRYRLRIHALAATARAPLTFCRAAAAALWDLPWLGPWPPYADVVEPPGSMSRSAGPLRRHREEVGALETRGGLRVTGLARTAVDVAREGDFARAVVVADAAVARGAVLDAELDLIAMRHGSARARAVARFADGRSGSPGESVSRASMRMLRLPEPVLQQEFPADRGSSWFVDFWWPEFEVIGEFDGESKYRDAGLRHGRSAEDVVVAEKYREDALRRRVRGFSRWGWSIARSPRLLAGRLALVGIRPLRQHTVL